MVLFLKPHQCLLALALSWHQLCFCPAQSRSVQFSCSVVSNSLWPHEPQHARLPCPSPIPRVYSNSCPLSRWCHPTISSSVVPFSSRLQSFPASGSFPMSQFFASGGHQSRSGCHRSRLCIFFKKKVKKKQMCGVTLCRRKWESWFSVLSICFLEEMADILWFS